MADLTKASKSFIRQHDRPPYALVPVTYTDLSAIFRDLRRNGGALHLDYMQACKIAVELQHVAKESPDHA